MEIVNNSLLDYLKDQMLIFHKNLEGLKKKKKKRVGEIFTVFKNKTLLNVGLPPCWMKRINANTHLINGHYTHTYTHFIITGTWCSSLNFPCCVCVCVCNG